tara:strand:- start:16409 stop:17509 length:1101 start_codon:yes stop_codon:yes gene_type:complete
MGKSYSLDPSSKIKFEFILISFTVLFSGCFSSEGVPHVEPAAFHPELVSPFEGNLAVNRELTKLTWLGKGELNGPEDVALDEAGNLFSTNEDGTIKKISPTGEMTVFANTSGRPLGMKFAPSGDLMVADGLKGLLSISISGEINVLVKHTDDFPLTMADDLDISSGGVVYFSDVTSPEVGNDFFNDILIHRPFGRLLKYDTDNKECKVILDSLYFANGVALSPDEEFVLVAETGNFQITRLWIKGPKKGQRDLFSVNLPGYPDGIMGDGKGNYWMALFSPRKPIVDKLYSPRVWLKKILLRIPEWARPKPENYGLIVLIDSNGEIIRSLHDQKGKTIANITNVIEHDGKLYIGTLYGDGVGIYDLN